jgi:hypothetical protein
VAWLTLGAVREETEPEARYQDLIDDLPAARVDELVAAGEGVRFDANKGTPMREWFSLDPESALPWLPLARQALDFAEAAHSGGKAR